MKHEPSRFYKPQTILAIQHICSTYTVDQGGDWSFDEDLGYEQGLIYDAATREARAAIRCRIRSGLLG
jgi:hypothetical protein